MYSESLCLCPGDQSTEYPLLMFCCCRRTSWDRIVTCVLPIRITLEGRTAAYSVSVWVSLISVTAMDLAQQW